MTFLYYHENPKAEILSLDVKNLSTTTFTRLIFRVIVKTFYTAFFSSANFTYLLSCYCLLFFSFYPHPFLPYFKQPTSNKQK